MKKRVVSILLSGIMTAMALTSCGSPGTQEEKKEDSEQVTLQYWFQGTTQTDEEFAERCIESFNEKYPNIKVEAQGLSTTISDQETKLNAATLSDTYPDVIALVLAEVGAKGSRWGILSLWSPILTAGMRKIMFWIAHMKWENIRENSLPSERFLIHRFILIGRMYFRRRA